MTEVISFLDLPSDILIELMRVDRNFIGINHETHELYLSNKDYINCYKVYIDVVSIYGMKLLKKIKTISLTYLEFIGVSFAFRTFNNPLITIIKFPNNLPNPLYGSVRIESKTKDSKTLKFTINNRIRESSNCGTYISFHFPLFNPPIFYTLTLKNKKKFAKEFIDGIVKYIKAVYDDIRFLIVNGVNLISL